MLSWLKQYFGEPKWGTFAYEEKHELLKAFRVAVAACPHGQLALQVRIEATTVDYSRLITWSPRLPLDWKLKLTLK